MTDEELIARLRSLRSHIFGAGTIMLVADRIETLVKEAKAAEKEIANLRENYDAVFARAERLEEALRDIAAVTAYRLPQDIASIALKGADHE